MGKILDYMIIENFADTATSLIYRGKKEDDDSTVIIKILKSESSSPSEIARFKQEYEIIKNIPSEGVVKVFDILQDKNSFAIIEEDFDGISLREHLKKHAVMDSLSFLKTAVKLAATLAEIHKNNIIHKDIKPHNIIVNPKKGIVKITNFGIANELTHKNEEVYRPDVIEGTLLYMSPEQTGRMNRSVDYRTDLYSLGVTFYEMLTGRTPFEANDPLEIIHSHIAKIPVSPAKEAPSIPEIISNIVMKLLSKNVEDRYQNSLGLMYDLQECLHRLENNNRIDPFQLCLKDVSIKFNVPQAIIGREKEIGMLLDAFERMCGGAREVMLVSGNPGIGKSAMVSEIHKPLAARRGYFISGKYEQFRKYVPYSAIIQAFTGLTRQILSERSDMIDRWRKDIQDAVGPNGKYITDLIPMLELIIGKQPETPQLGPEETQSVFNFVFKKFVAVFADEKHPLSLFLDDLQWADAPSLKILKGIVTDNDIQYLFLIGAYRDNEVNESHPLMAMRNEMTNMDVTIHTLPIGPLDVMHMNTLTSNFLRCAPDVSMPLSELIQRKTMGNPFFAIQFLKQLYEGGLIELDPAAGWRWDVDKIKSMQVTDNVVDLMAQKISSLSEQNREILKICSCIGNRFDLESLAEIQGASIDKTLLSLIEAIEEGFINFTGSFYAFHHDRIQEAAYSLIPDITKKELHVKIGRYFYKTTSPENLSEKIFFIVDQFNLGLDLIADRTEKNIVSRLNMGAGNKAKASAAFRAAFNYYNIGMVLLGDLSWETDYEHTLTLYSLSAETAYICANYEEMERLTAIIQQRARTLLDKVKSYEILIMARMAQNRLKDAIATGFQILEILGVKFPRQPKKIHLIIALIKMKMALKRIGTDGLFDRPRMKDPVLLAAMRIMASVNSAAYWAQPELLPLLIFKGCLLSMKYGNDEFSPYFYTGIGIMFCTDKIGDIENAFTITETALRLLDKINLPAHKTKTYFVMNTYVRHWKQHSLECIGQLREGYRNGVETGDTEYASHSLMVTTFLSYLSGRNLALTELEASQHVDLLKDIKHKTDLNMVRLYRQAMLNLIGKSDSTTRLIGTSYNEEEMLPQHLSANDHYALFNVYLNKLILCIIFQDYEQAYEHSSVGENEYQSAMTASFNFSTFVFYDSIAKISQYNRQSLKKQKMLLLKINKNIRRLKKWSQHASMNHLHRYCLAEAELARVSGNDAQAALFYEKAIMSAHENDYLQDEALAYELAARYYLNRKSDEIGSLFLNRSQQCYATWGAVAKVNDMKRKYGHIIADAPPELLTKPDGSKSPSNTVTASTASLSMDLSTVIKSHHALSSEFDLGKLLEKIMKIAIENAGAEWGYFILKNENDGNLYIEAEGSIGTKITVMQSIPVADSGKLSAAIINYVNSTNENLVLNNACEEGLFTADPYIRDHRTKSVLCSPIMYQKKTSGIIYLENNLTTNAFVADRFELLRILSSLAAISIENARLLTHRENAARLQMEMQIAEKIQTSLLPNNPRIAGYDIVGYMKTADEVGGDYYDVINAAGRDWLVIGDVSGHGVPAGLVMMMVQTSIHNVLNMDPNLEPSRLLVLINSVITRNILMLADNKYVTITVFSCHDNGRFVFSGLHQDIMIFRKQKNDVEVVASEGIWIGIMEHIDDLVKDKSLNLDIGDTMLLYTDGITESLIKENTRGQWNTNDAFGETLLKDILKKFGNAPVREIKNGVVEELKKYVCNDDVTMMIIRRNE